MQIIKRRIGESIYFYDDAVIVTILDIKPSGEVRLGIKTSAEIAVRPLEESTPPLLAQQEA